MPCLVFVVTTTVAALLRSPVRRACSRGLGARRAISCPANFAAIRKINGINCNFYVYYEIDRDTFKHNLALDAYGEGDGWVLLEPM